MHFELFFVRFLSNTSRLLLMAPNDFLSTLGLQSIFWKPPNTPDTLQKIFEKIDFRAWKSIFQAWELSELEKTHFWAIFTKQNFLKYFVSCPITLRGERIWPNAKICRADFWLNKYFLKKRIFCISMLKNPTKSKENPSFLVKKNPKKFKNFIFQKMFLMAPNEFLSTPRTDLCIRSYSFAS